MFLRWGGRPVEFLVYWLLLGGAATNKEQHKKASLLNCLKSVSSHQERAECRRSVAASTDGATLLSYERTLYRTW